jgi:putative holliday junction resolvase
MLTSYLALDVGRARIGVALANSIARIASPLPAIANDDTMLQQLRAYIAEHDVSQLVVGWPRGLQGQETEQTAYVDAFVQELEQALDMSIAKQDEAATSLKAEAELKARGKHFDKGDIDSLSAVYILEDYLTEGVH